ncbi:uncharacterized protein pld7 isoform X2 [Amia ocellicauda]|uniref:uncharacterized protein pld7 isoform X2 n=1 Tax=Amia ocellicauda TaxID=2972642 RepID=UPI003463A4EA
MDLPGRRNPPCVQRSWSQDEGETEERSEAEEDKDFLPPRPRTKTKNPEAQLEVEPEPPSQAKRRGRPKKTPLKEPPLDTMVSHLQSPTVVLRRLKMEGEEEDEGESDVGEREEMEGEEPTGTPALTTRPPASRIPTFHPSTGRPRPPERATGAQLTTSRPSPLPPPTGRPALSEIRAQGGLEMPPGVMTPATLLPARPAQRPAAVPPRALEKQTGPTEPKRVGGSGPEPEPPKPAKDTPPLTLDPVTPRVVLFPWQATPHLPPVAPHRASGVEEEEEEGAGHHSLLTPRPALRAEMGPARPILRPEAAQQPDQPSADLSPTRRGRPSRGLQVGRERETGTTAPEREEERETGSAVPEREEEREEVPPVSEAERGRSARPKTDIPLSQRALLPPVTKGERQEVGSAVSEPGSKGEAVADPVGQRGRPRRVAAASEKERELEAVALKSEARGEAPRASQGWREEAVFKVGAGSGEPARVIVRARRKHAALKAGAEKVEAALAADPAPEPRKQRGKGRVWRCCSALLCLLPLLLISGGAGLYVWHAGLPPPLGALVGQMDLDWLWAGGPWGQEPCSTDCSLSLVESLPEGLNFGPQAPLLPSIAEAWEGLLRSANHSVNIAAFYFTLRDTDTGGPLPSALPGQRIFEQLKGLQSRGVRLRIAVNGPQSYTRDTEELAAAGAEVRSVELKNLTGGIVHTKLWVLDNEHAYIGSANMDWRSLTQVKELGVLIRNCSCLAQDVSQLFQVYWALGSPEHPPALPPHWPLHYRALSRAQRPLELRLNGHPATVYLSSSPPPLLAHGRTDDLAAIEGAIGDARRIVFVSVMDFLPSSQFQQPARFWPVLDGALRAAGCGGVEVRLLVSCWAHSPPAMFVYLRSLAVLQEPPLSCNIHVRVFQVPSSEAQQQIPFSRVNHAKYLVTDRVAYIGTSNWSEDYFTQTAGVGMVVNQTRGPAGGLRGELQAVFQRDWESSYTTPLRAEHTQLCGKHT